MSDDILIQAILVSGVKIPPLPAVLVRMNAVLADENAGPMELGRVLREDGALTGALFRLAGSAVFGLRSPVASVEQAIAVLGMRTAAATARAAALRLALHDQAHTRALDQLWSHGARIAYLMLSAIKARHISGVNADVAYTVGQFHDCGLALFFKRYPAYSAALAQVEGWRQVRELDAAHGVSHAVAGLLVARNWMLPDEAGQAIRHHHDLNSPDLSDSTRRYVALYQFASRLHEAAQGEQEPDQWDPEWCDSLRRILDAKDLKRWMVDISALTD